jgi:hypothetical protein
MKKMLKLATMALCAMMMMIGLTMARANTVLIPVFVTGTAPTSGVITMLVDDATGKYLSVDVSRFPDTTFVMKILTDTSGGISISQIDPTITKPVISYGAVNAPEHNTYNTEIVFQINNKPSSDGSGRYYGGVVIFYNPNGWTFSAKTYKLMIHVGGTGTDGTSSCWIGETVPPTACTVFKFYGTESTNTVVTGTNYVYKYIASLKRTIRVAEYTTSERWSTTIYVGLTDVFNSSGFDILEQQTDGSCSVITSLLPNAIDTSFTFTPSLTRTGLYRLVDKDTMVGPVIAGNALTILNPLPIIEPAAPAAPNTN